jgi:peptide/nickel transport system permease protein
VLVLNFLLPHLQPGNFIEIYAAKIAAIHHVPRAQIVAELTKVFGLPQSLGAQFKQYMEETLLSFPPNFGPSFEFYPLGAWSVVFTALKWTLLLLGVSQSLAWFISIFIGVYLALKKNSMLDRVLQPAFYFLNSIPGFWLGLMFIFVFAIELHVLPSGQAYGLTLTLPSLLQHMVLPVAVLILISAPGHIIVARSAAIDVIGSDFLQATKAQGLRKSLLVWRVLRNSLLPSVTNIFLTIGYLIGGVITVEFTFSYPGIGTVIANAVIAEDYPVMMAAFYITTLVALLCNLAADLLYPVIDARVSYAK